MSGALETITVQRKTGVAFDGARDSGPLPYMMFRVKWRTLRGNADTSVTIWEGFGKTVPQAPVPVTDLDRANTPIAMVHFVDIDTAEIQPHGSCERYRVRITDDD